MCLGIPGKVEVIKGKEAVVDLGGVKRKVRLDLVEDLSQGDYVIVHAGFVIQKLTKEEAKDLLNAIEELGEAMNW
ncbi:MAG: HypC/HybG/HupF family hydrogenase formation chaperone [Thermoproteota archaeon]|nr:HypC/HybG/HupF family hydrogenase formation chaperone [Candidatus Brockarchaeota archaeon]MBO3801279.1 HypC/HybG/HupF family hydrogenase formation chaperone [Candidatus Brockarchaeota archaeon]